jgi:hypothetical protein
MDTYWRLPILEIRSFWGIAVQYDANYNLWSSNNPQSTVHQLSSTGLDD